MTDSTLFNRLPSIIPFERETTGRYAPWILAFIMYISLLASFSSLIFLRAIDYWHPGATKTLTLSIPFDHTCSTEHTSQEACTEKKVNQIIDVISETPYTIQVSILSETEMLRLLSPWFEKNFNPYDVILPTLINVKVDVSSQSFDTQSLLKKIDEIVPNVTILKNISWQSIIEQSALKIQLFILGILILIFLSAAWTTTFITRTNMLMQRDIIELLTLLGSTDKFIAKRYTHRTFLMALESLTKAVIGFIITIGFIWWAIHEVDQSLFGFIVWHLLNWKVGLLILTPVLIIVLMITSVKRCVLKTLEELF